MGTERARERRGSRNRVRADGASKLPRRKKRRRPGQGSRRRENRANHHLAQSGSVQPGELAQHAPVKLPGSPRRGERQQHQHNSRPRDHSHQRPATSKQAGRRVRQIVFATPALVTRQRIHGPLIGHGSNLPPVPPETEPRGPAGCSVSKHPRLAGWRPISTRRGMRLQGAGCLLPWDHGSRGRKGLPCEALCCVVVCCVARR